MAVRRIYLDHNAGASLRPEARASVIDALSATGNASSVHAEGRAARGRIEAARIEVARLAGVAPTGVTFVSGGSEANATVLTPDWSLDGKATRFDRLFVGATEHPSVLCGGRFAPEAVSVLPVDRDGLIDRAVLDEMLGRAAVAGERVLVSVMLANNETGTIQPLAEIAALVHAHGGFVHCDAIQAAGRLPIALGFLGIDVATLSAHKIGGPQGAGAIVRADAAARFKPLIAGGGQETFLRAGTENVAAIAGFGAAAKAAVHDLARAKQWAGWRDGLAAFLKTDCGATVFSEGAPRLPQTLAFGVDGASAETLLIALDLAGFALSSGSACSSGKVRTSHVLAAQGIAPALAKSALRLSFGWETTEEDLDMFREAWRSVSARVFREGSVRAA